MASDPEAPNPSRASDGAAPPVAGTWDLVISTPIGRQRVELVLVEDADGLRGTATGDDESVAITAATQRGTTVSWRQSITRPLRLNLEFAVEIDGDALIGTARAGRLPRSKVTGRRRG